MDNTIKTKNLAMQMALEAYNDARRGNGARPLIGFSKAWWAVNGRTWMIKAREIRQGHRMDMKAVKSKTKLEEAVEAFNQAYAVLQFVTGSLNKLVQAEVKHMKTSEQVLELIDKLPKRYGGCRRLYEMVIMLDEEKERR